MRIPSRGFIHKYYYRHTYKHINRFNCITFPPQARAKRYSLPMNVRAIRGAIQVTANDPLAIGEGSKELLSAILKANSLDISDVISVLLTASPDLNAAFPASAAREIGFASVPLLCAQEIDVPQALPRTIRVMLHCNTERSASEIEHVYLHGATVLRKDLAQ